MKKYQGFTIVELLIVIVVIGILAALVLNSFANAQAKANNTKKISAVSQVAKLIKGYEATYGEYPLFATGYCATTDNQCTDNSGNARVTDNASLITELRKIGPVPESAQPPVSGNRYGIQYIYESTATLDGQLKPVRLEYWLQGDNVKCGVPGVSNASTSTAVTPSTGYTSSSGGVTVCWIRL